MLDQRKYRKNALRKLYAQRWNIEVDLRFIKRVMHKECSVELLKEAGEALLKIVRDSLKTIAEAVIFNALEGLNHARLSEDIAGSILIKRWLEVKKIKKSLCYEIYINLSLGSFAGMLNSCQFNLVALGHCPGLVCNAALGLVLRKIYSHDFVYKDEGVSPARGLKALDPRGDEFVGSSSRYNETATADISGFFGNISH